jgi:rubrerythrin
MVINGLGATARAFSTLVDELAQGTQVPAVPYFQINSPANPMAPGQYVPSNQVNQQVTGVRYCAFCGTPVPADGQHAYCPQCGAAIQE